MHAHCSHYSVRIFSLHSFALFVCLFAFVECVFIFRLNLFHNEYKMCLHKRMFEIEKWRGYLLPCSRLSSPPYFDPLPTSSMISGMLLANIACLKYVPICYHCLVTFFDFICANEFSQGKKRERKLLGGGK